MPPLRAAVQEVAEKIGADMERRGVRMIRPAVPVRFDREAPTEEAPGVNGAGRIKCTFKNLDFGLEMSESFDTV